jgi:hypothetical protein
MSFTVDFVEWAIAMEWASDPSDIDEWVNGLSAIHWVCMGSYPEPRDQLYIMKECLAGKPDGIYVKDKYGLLPIHYACLNEELSVDVLMFLIQYHLSCGVSCWG